MKKKYPRLLAVIVFAFVIILFVIFTQPARTDNVFEIIQDLAPANFSLAAELCEQHQFPESCIQYFAETHSDKNSNATFDFCAKLRNVALHDWCFQGIVEHWAWTTIWARKKNDSPAKLYLSAPEAIEICAAINASFEDSWFTPKHDCYKHLGDGIGSLSLPLDRKIELCLKIDEMYGKEHCVQSSIKADADKNSSFAIELCRKIEKNFSFPKYIAETCIYDIVDSVASHRPMEAIKICESEFGQQVNILKCKMQHIGNIAIGNASLAIATCQQIQDRTTRGECYARLLPLVGILNVSVEEDLQICDGVIIMSEKDRCHFRLVYRLSFLQHLGKQIALSDYEYICNKIRDIDTYQMCMDILHGKQFN